MAKKKTGTVKKVGEAVKDAADAVKKKVVKPAAKALGLGGAKKSAKSGTAKKSSASKSAKSGAAKKSGTTKSAKSGAAKKKSSSS